MIVAGNYPFEQISDLSRIAFPLRTPDGSQHCPRPILAECAHAAINRHPSTSRAIAWTARLPHRPGLSAATQSARGEHLRAAPMSHDRVVPFRRHNPKFRHVQAYSPSTIGVVQIGLPSRTIHHRLVRTGVSRTDLLYTTDQIRTTQAVDSAIIDRLGIHLGGETTHDQRNTRPDSADVSGAESRLTTATEPAPR